jgi:hypothetical protein
MPTTTTVNFFLLFHWQESIKWLRCASIKFLTLLFLSFPASHLLKKGLG